MRGLPVAAFVTTAVVVACALLVQTRAVNASAAVEAEADSAAEAEADRALALSSFAAVDARAASEADADADSNADADTDADARTAVAAAAAGAATADAANSRAAAEAQAQWEQYGVQWSAPDKETNGEMHWLREMIVAKVKEVDGADRKMPTYLVGEPNIDRNKGVYLHNRFDPEQPPMTWAMLWSLLNLHPDSLRLLTEHTAAVLAYDPNKKEKDDAYLPLNVPGENAMKKCHLDVIQFLFRAGAGQVRKRGFSTPADAKLPQSTVKESQDWAEHWKLALGRGFVRDGMSHFGIDTCDINAKWDDVKAWAQFIKDQPAGFKALRDHAARFHAYAKFDVNTDYDIAELRGWLYATDRKAGRGHRLVGATGWATYTPNGVEHTVPVETNAVKLKEFDGSKVTDANMGLNDDTAGHVRPRALGGQRDPINFVPQSKMGQKIVNVAEELAMALSKWCPKAGSPPTQIRYGVVFTYTNDKDRRPASAVTWVDLLGERCDAAALGGSVSPKDNIYVWDHTLY